MSQICQGLCVDSFLGHPQLTAAMSCTVISAIFFASDSGVSTRTKRPESAQATFYCFEHERFILVHVILSTQEFVRDLVSHKVYHQHLHFRHHLGTEK